MPRLDWDGKKAVENLQVPFHLLREVPALGCPVNGGEADPGAGNLLVQGDNLLALKALLPRYAGQVKCIYIDPPYNTGNEGWVYNDNVNSPVIREWLGKAVGKEAEDFSRHDKWLCMMYPRLRLLWQFLRDDGSIWISIDDNEVNNMRSICDELFGRSSFIASNIWQKRYSRENREAIGDVHEYVLVYAKQPSKFKEIRNQVPLDEDQAKVYRNPNNDPRGRWRPIPMTAQAGHATPEQFYEITAPSGKTFRPSQGRCWGMAQRTFEKLKTEGRIYFGKLGNSQPNVIRYLSEVPGLTPWTWWPHTEVGHTDEATKELYQILGKAVAFDNPKPARLVKRVLQIATNPGDLILDSFAGSGTTGDAVLQMNKQDGGNRRCILVEMEPRIARDITAERLRRVASGYTRADGTTVPGLGGGFRYLELGEPMFDPATGQIHPAVTFADLARHVWFTATREPAPERHDGPLLGVSRAGVGVYLLFNGILKDRSPGGGNVLTARVLAGLPPHDGPRLVYATGCRMDDARLRELGVTFRQTPYQIAGAEAASP